MRTLTLIKKTFWLLLVLLALGSQAWALEGLQVGMTAPLFQLKDLKGKEFSLAGQRDANAAVVVFWAAWSDHSTTLLERLEKLYRKHRREKLSILAVNVERQLLGSQELAEVRKMIARLGLSFPVLIDDGLKVFREYGVVAVPSTVVIDKEGIIRGEMAAYPLAVREELFDLIDAMAEKRDTARKEEKKGYQPIPRAVRYYNLARAMAGRGMSDAVDENLKRAISTDPNFTLPLLLLARLYRERADTEEAIEYQRAATVTATFRSEKERYLKEASALTEKALKLAPQNPHVLTEAALILLSQGKKAAARERLSEALKIESTHTPARFFLAALLVSEGKIKEGELEFQRALQLNPLDYQGYFALARAYDERGMSQKAIEAYKKVYAILYRERELFPHSYGR